MLERCITFRRTFDDQHKAGELLFEEGVVNINLPSSKHGDKGRGQVMVAFIVRWRSRKMNNKLLRASQVLIV